MLNYEIVSASTPSDLAKKVNAKLAEGAILYGDPFINPVGSNFLYNQAVTTIKKS